MSIEYEIRKQFASESDLKEALGKKKERELAYFNAQKAEVQGLATKFGLADLLKETARGFQRLVPCTVAYETRETDDKHLWLGEGFGYPFTEPRESPYYLQYFLRLLRTDISGGYFGTVMAASISIGIGKRKIQPSSYFLNSNDPRSWGNGPISFFVGNEPQRQLPLLCANAYEFARSVANYDTRRNHCFWFDTSILEDRGQTERIMGSMVTHLNWDSARPFSGGYSPSRGTDSMGDFS